MSPLQVFGKIPSLIYLYLQKNQLKEVPASLPEGLEQLRLSRNRISKVPPGAFQKLKHLVLLDLYHNQVRGDPFSSVLNASKSTLESTHFNKH